MTCFIENDFTLSVSYLDENRSDMNGYIHAQIQIIIFFVISDPIRDRQIVLAALDIKYTTLNDTVRKLNIQTLI